jgi:cytochrome c55X
LPVRAIMAMMMIAIAGQALADPPPTERQAELAHLLRHDCGSCHGLTMRGGLGPALSPQALAGKDDQALTEIVLDGVPGTPMPPWRFELSRDEAAWMIARLKAGIGP